MYNKLQLHTYMHTLYLSLEVVITLSFQKQWICDICGLRLSQWWVAFLNLYVGMYHYIILLFCWVKLIHTYIINSYIWIFVWISTCVVCYISYFIIELVATDHCFTSKPLHLGLVYVCIVYLRMCIPMCYKFVINP